MSDDLLTTVLKRRAGSDRAETHDLAAERPAKVEELAKLWTKQYEDTLALAGTRPSSRN